MKNSNRDYSYRQAGFVLVAVLIIATAILAVAGGGYWWLQNRAKVTVPNTNQQVTSLQQGATDKTQNWETYFIKEYGLSLKYPDKIGEAEFKPQGGYDPCIEGCPKNYYWEGT